MAYTTPHEWDSKTAWLDLPEAYIVDDRPPPAVYRSSEVDLCQLWRDSICSRQGSLSRRHSRCQYLACKNTSSRNPCFLGALKKDHATCVEEPFSAPKSQSQDEDKSLPCWFE